MSTRRSRSSATRSDRARPRAATGGCIWLPARGQRRGAQENEQEAAPLAAAPMDHAQPGRARRCDQPGRAGLDALLRPVLPVGVVAPPRAHQHLPDALGWTETQTTADLQTLQSVVARDPRSRPRPIHALALDPPPRLTEMRRAE